MSNHRSMTAARTLLAGFALTGTLAILPMTIAAPANATPYSTNSYGSTANSLDSSSTPGDNRRVEDRSAAFPAPNRNPLYDSRCQDQPIPVRACQPLTNSH